jgi:hypothetical protein
MKIAAFHHNKNSSYEHDNETKERDPTRSYKEISFTAFSGAGTGNAGDRTTHASQTRPWLKKHIKEVEN